MLGFFFSLSPIEIAIIALVVVAILVVLLNLTRRRDED